MKAFLIVFLTMIASGAGNKSTAKIAIPTPAPVQTEVSTQEMLAESAEPTEEVAEEVENEEEPTLEEKYQHNEERKEQPEGTEDVWYDVPECEEHDFATSEYCDGDGYGIEYLCNRCGYSYTEPITEEQFMEGLE